MGRRTKTTRRGQQIKTGLVGGGEVCFTLKTIWPPINVGDVVERIVNTVSYSLNRKYDKAVWICVYSNRVEISIRNGYSEYIDTCATACMAAFEELKRSQEGYVGACYDKCREVVKEDAYKSLYDTYMSLKEELTALGFELSAEFSDERPPQALKAVVRL